MKVQVSEATLIILASIAGRVTRNINGDAVSNESETNPFDLERRIAQRILNKKEVEGAENVIK